MKKPRRRLRESRPAFLFGLLLLSLVLTAILAYQAVDAARSYRATAESVLRDYAALAAREFVRRTANQLDYYQFRPALNLVRAAAPGLPEPGRPPDDSGGPRPSLARSYFRLQLPDAPAQLRGTDQASFFSPEIRREMQRQAAQWTARGQYSLQFAPDGDSVLIFRSSASAGGNDAVEGFVADTESIVQQMKLSLQRGPLMPPTLGGESLDNSLLSISVRRPSGERIFQGEQAYGYTRISAYEQFGQGMGELEAVVTLHPDAAPRLIIGGLPSSRVPLLLALMLLNMGLLATALVQLRRERELARRQSDFIAAVSHELRTPLAQIQMFSDTLLLGRVRSGEEETRSLEIISQEAQRLTHLVDNIIQFSRSMRRKINLRPRPTDPLPVLREILERFAPLASSTKARLRLVSGVSKENRCRISVDADALRRIVLNLLDNAIKYGPAGQTVTLDLSRLENRVSIRVTDQGEGIASADRERIWKRFERLLRHRNAAVAGTGIGLSVVRELAEAQGGRAWVEPAEGGGACFVVEFPALDKALRPDPDPGEFMDAKAKGAEPEPRSSEASG
ncbi:MAG: HAMP domain-containing sensor histidine kinase [Acidobacteriota bacterium]